MNAEIILEVENWHNDRKISFDRAKFVTLYEEGCNSSYVIDIFSKEGELNELLDYFDGDLKREDLEEFFQELENLRVYRSESEIAEEFIEGFGIDTHSARFLARYLDEWKIVQDFLHDGGFEIGLLFCARY